MPLGILGSTQLSKKKQPKPHQATRKTHEMRRCAEELYECMDNLGAFQSKLQWQKHLVIGAQIVLITADGTIPKCQTPKVVIKASRLTRPFDLFAARSLDLTHKCLGSG